MSDGTVLDHLVVAAKSLDEGRAWVREQLEVDATTGGSHDGLGTHNVLVALGARRYLEVISIDPDVAPPSVPRWFGLDTSEVGERLALGPALVAWVARCAGSDDEVERLGATPGYGPVVVRPASRGALRWRFAFSPTGDRLMHGVLPHLIQWDSAEHPADHLPETGVTLTRLELAAPEPSSVESLLDAMRLDRTDVRVVQGPQPSLVATLTARGGDVVV